MMRFKAGSTCLFGTLAALGALASGPVALAVTVDFESPAYAAGGIAGQDGWVVTSYAATPNGTLEVSATGPLSGGQSIRYARTNTNLGPFSAADVTKADVVTVVADGTGAADLNASFLISASSLANQSLGFGAVSFFLSPNGVGGQTPIGIQLNNAGSSIPSIEVFANYTGVGPAFGYLGGTQPAAAFPEGNTLEFDLDVDFDSSTFTVAYRNVTAGGAFSSPAGPYAFASGFPAGPGGAIGVDVIAGFRFGAGQLDDVTLTGNLVPEPTTLGLGLASVAAMCLHRRKRA